MEIDNGEGLKCKKANRRSEKLFIGLTTKPCLILKNETKTTQLSFQMFQKTSSWKFLSLGKKALQY